MFTVENVLKSISPTELLLETDCNRTYRSWRKPSVVLARPSWRWLLSDELHNRVNSGYPGAPSSTASWALLRAGNAVSPCVAFWSTPNPKCWRPAPTELTLKRMTVSAGRKPLISYLGHAMLTAPTRILPASPGSSCSSFSGDTSLPCPLSYWVAPSLAPTPHPEVDDVCERT